MNNILKVASYLVTVMLLGRIKGQEGCDGEDFSFELENYNGWNLPYAKTVGMKINDETIA